jgi:hypothetical protein
VPFVASIDCGREVLTAAIGSDLFEGHAPALCGFLRVVVEFQPPTSFAVGIDIPFA